MRFAIIGAAGYIAPRHMQAIVDNGGEIVSACDDSDSVGILDRYAPRCRFTKNSGLFFSELADVDVVVICTPNWLHHTYAARAMSEGCDVVLEKPLATTAANAQWLIDHTPPGRRVYPVCQLRLHPAIAMLRERLKTCGPVHVEIDYAVFRGDWYGESWKGDEAKSGGILVNIGVHLFDLCCYLFDSVMPDGARAYVGDSITHGSLVFSNADVDWRLTTKADETRRIFRVNGETIDLSDRIGELHRDVYADVMAGRGIDIEDACRALRVIDEIKEVAR